MTKSIAVLAALALSGTAGLSLAATTPAHASVLMTLQQETGAASCGGASPCVVASGSGTLDITDLTLMAGGPFTQVPLISPAGSTITVGSQASIDIYSSIIGPVLPIGTGGTVGANSGSGDLFGVTDVQLEVPHGYTSGNSLSGTAIWNSPSDNTLALLGVTPGTYKYTWGSGEDADSFTLEVLNPVPVPAALPLLATGLGLLGLIFGGSRWAIRTV
jgi:hypothetical protein